MCACARFSEGGDGGLLRAYVSAARVTVAAWHRGAVAAGSVACTGRAVLPARVPGLRVCERRGVCGGVCVNTSICVEIVCNCVYGAELIFGLGFWGVSLPVVGRTGQEIQD